jgi:uncharacterized protein (TIGR02594 family)
MKPLPTAYEDLYHEPGPNMLLQLLALYGTIEGPGAQDNPVIMAWADECGIRGYVHDFIAWCGLTQAVVAKRAGWEYAPQGNALWALNWQFWGQDVHKCPHVARPALGDILVFTRKGGGHVAQYVGEDDRNYHILGGNQGDAVSVSTHPKSSLVAARRAPWRIAQPANVRTIQRKANGNLQVSEA